MGATYAWHGIAHHTLVRRQQNILHRLAGSVPALEQDRLWSQAQQRQGLLQSSGLIERGRGTEQQGRFRYVGRHQAHARQQRLAQ